ENGKAAEALRAALAHRPSEPSLHVELGDLWMSLGQYEAAQQSFTKAVELGPHEGLAQLKLGLALAKLGNEAGALIRFEQATRLAPQVREGWVQYARAKSKEGASEEAIDAW